ncbi:Hypothetical protein, putative, partial [Bodo saltans]
MKPKTSASPAAPSRGSRPSVATTQPQQSSPGQQPPRQQQRTSSQTTAAITSPQVSAGRRGSDANAPALNNANRRTDAKITSPSTSKQTSAPAPSAQQKVISKRSKLRLLRNTLMSWPQPSPMVQRHFPHRLHLHCLANSATTMQQHVVSSVTPPQSQLNLNQGNQRTSSSPAPRDPMGTSPSYDLLDEHNSTSSNNLNNAGGAPASSSPLFRHQRATLLEKVQLVGHGLLHWCGVLETQRLPSDVTLDAVAHNVALLSRDLNAALQDCLVKCEGLLFPSTDGVTKRGLARVAGSLPTSRSPSAGRGGSPPPALDRGQQRAANFWSYYKRECFDPCFANLGQLTSNAKLFVLMRELVASRDGAKVETLLAELKRQSSSTTSGAQRPALRVGNDPSRNAFVQWVETRWLPAVKEWEELIRNAKKQIESDGETTGSSSGPITQQPQQQQQREHMLSTPAAAAMSRNAAKIATAADRAIASVHRDIVSRSASLKEILRPGETVEQLLHGSVEADLRALAKQKIAQRDALDALRTAVEKVQFVQLASCLREAEPFLPYLSNQSADRSLIAEAQSLLVDVQRVAKTTVGI